MTETQTPNPDCSNCGGTGFIPPFMDACACALAAMTAPDWLPPLTSVPPVWGSGDADFDELMSEADEWDERQKATEDLVADEEDTPPPMAYTAMSAEDEAWVPPIHIVNVAMHTAPEVEAKTGKPATPAQAALLTRLIAERDPLHSVVAHATIQAVTPLTAREASTLIDALMAVPADPTRKKPRSNKYDGACRACGGTVPAETGRIEKVDGRWVTFHLDGDCLTAEAKAALEADLVTEPGLYTHEVNGEPQVYRVRKARTSHRLYAELVVAVVDGVVSFQYNAKAMAFLRKSAKLTWAEARAFGAAYGSCIDCGRTLSDARSLVQGYGNTCAGHYGWPTVTKKQAEQVIAGVLTWEDVIADLGVLTS